MTIGRNDPCPCGSGKKFKHCCLERAGLAALGETFPDPLDEFRAALDSESFPSLQEAQAFLDAFTQQRNQTPIDDFHGLAPDEYLEGQMYADVKHEYVNGQIYAMVGVSRAHNLITRNWQQC